MDVEMIKQIAIIMKEMDIHTLEVEEKEQKYRFERSNKEQSQANQSSNNHHANQNNNLPTHSNTIKSENNLLIHNTIDNHTWQSNTDKEQEYFMNEVSSMSTISLNTKDTFRKIKSPMVGFFHTSPSPKDKSFVSVGDHVKKGQVLCLIEAMKLFNEIQATEDGIIRDILVESGEIVNYGQELFLYDHVE